MKDLGELKYFLGIKVALNSSCFFLCQHKYTLDIITEVGFLGNYPATFPIEQNHQRGLAIGAKIYDSESY